MTNARKKEGPDKKGPVDRHGNLENMNEYRNMINCTYKTKKNTTMNNADPTLNRGELRWSTAFFQKKKIAENLICRKCHEFCLILYCRLIYIKSLSRAQKTNISNAHQNM